MKEYLMRPFKHESDEGKGYQWVLAQASPVVKSVAQLLAEFYDLFQPDDTHPWQPLVWRRNPEKEGRAFFPNRSVILGAFRRDYFLLIEKCFTSVTGPHSCVLQHRLPSQEMIWIAIAQIECLFHSDERLQDAATAVVRDRLLWHSPETSKTLINIQ